MIRLVHADRTAPLLDALAEDVAEARRHDGPFEPLTLAVSGPAVRAHVEQGLALRLGIAAHLQVRSLRAVLADVVARSEPGVELAGPNTIAGACLELLHDPELVRDPRLAPVARYLDGVDRDARDERRVDLAQALGQLYDSYVLHRPQWLQAWRAEAPAPDAAPEPTWSWQGALFRRLAAIDPPHGPLSPGLPDLGQPRRRWLLGDALASIETWRGPRRLFLFDVPIRSEVLASAIARLAETTAVHVYAVNPCQEFWEDMPSRFTPTELADRLAHPDPSTTEAPDPASDPPALRLWGRTGRQEHRIASALAQWSAEGRYSASEAPPSTLLEALQRDVLLRAPDRAAPTPGAYEGDSSLQVISAPGIRRECEAIAAEIWRLITEHDDLRFSDVVVALGAPSETELYRSQLAAAFAEAGDIPTHEIEVAVAADSRVVDAVRLLLALPGSRFTRQDVLRVLTHPAVRARLGIGDTDDWTTWCERLGVVHGADHEDHVGTYIDRDLFNWDQGLRRLALGAYMAGEGVGRAEPVQLGEEPTLPTDFSAQELGSASRMVALVRSLIADARQLAAAELSLADWSSYLRAYVDTYVGAASDDDERDLYRVVSAVDDVGHLGRLEETRVSFRTAARLLEARLTGLRTQRGQPLAEAVVIAPLAQVASVPFRVAFLPGLGEGRFPAPHQPSALDLRRGDRRAGDVTPRMRDEYAFLLRLMASRDAVRLSFVGRDPRTGDELAPASTLFELIGILERGYVGPDHALVRRLPLRRLDEPGPSTAALGEASAAQLAAHLEAALPAGAPRPDLEQLRAALPPGTWARLARRLRLPSPPAVDPRAAARRPRVSLANLRRFLEDPLQGWARQVLLLSDEDDVVADPLSRTDEPFEPTRLQALSLLRETFLSWLAAGEPETALAERYARAALRMELGGRLPTGVFGEAARGRHLRTLAAWSRRAREALEGRRAPLARLELGRAASPDEPGIRVPGVELRNSVVIGRTEPLFDQGGCLVLLDRPMGSGRAAIRHEMKAWLAQLAWVASDRPAAGPWRAFVADEGEPLYRGALAPITADEARAHLERLTEDLLGGSHVHLFPLDTQLQLHRARDRGKSTRQLKDILDRARPDGFGPLREVPLAPPPLDQALDIVERRLAPLLAARRSEGAG